MADIVIDYELLNQLGKDTDTLKHKISDARTAKHDYSPNDVGPDASFMIEEYYGAWSGAFKHAWNLLESLSNTYTSVARHWFDQDAGYAATANEQAAGFTHSIWEMKKSAYDNWLKLSHTYVTVHGFDDNGNPYEKQVPLADPDKPPEAPGQAPTGYSFTASDGSTHNTTSTYDADGNLTSNDTVITDGSGGMSYHEHSTFGDNGSYTTTVEHPDGTKTTETVTGNANGSGTKVDTYTDTDGKTTTTTWTGTGVNGSNPQWTEDKKPGDDRPPQGGGNGAGGGQHHGAYQP
ncbi:hypothetical protein [Actinacidiphila acidipaludis]|uniref:YD repeat-containing protein n=1 Tax=Actinacidiphila acidipaludis TaxID=2873382 RepID=A0ABS7QIW6_9ACTN|nr:hypothetical protein [Streptomyces acidipaludis]MBY8883090.1 hypothetical protein [Streptomyces acidipaludis]